jgi:predicted lipoprotein with Yx(FWY)xxD motif
MVAFHRHLLNRFSLITVLFAILFMAACSPATTTVATKDVSKNTSPSAKTAAIPSNTPQPTDQSNVPVTGQSPTIMVSDQQVQNGTVLMDHVISRGPGWVVIFTTNTNGKPDKPIGHTAVKDGGVIDLQVPVEAESAQGTLVAVLLSDQGTVGTFEYPGADIPEVNGLQLVDESFKVGDTTAAAAPTSGNMDMTGMTSTPAPENTSSASNNNMNMGSTAPDVTPNIIVSNQPIINGQIVIPEVLAPQNAWLVIHKMNGDGSVGPMAGYVHVQAGDNKNVTVPLDTNLTSTTMSAMLHSDVAKAKSPQFPGPDEPIMANGQMLNPTFQITQSNNADVVITLGQTPETMNYLVEGSSGRTLYISLTDAPGQSNCTGDCLNNWQPLLATGRIVAGIGIPANKLGIIILPNGSRQVTYSNAPLYTFVQDEKPGDVKGQGMNGNWYLVTP